MAITTNIYWGLSSGTLYLSSNPIPPPTEYSGFFGGEEEFTNSSLVPWISYKDDVLVAEVLDSITPKYMAMWFYNCSNLVSITGLNNINTSECLSFRSLFYGCSGLTSIDVSSFNTSNVTTMYGMFWACRVLTYLDLSSWDTSKVTNMNSMFQVCEKLVTIHASNLWSTAAVTNSSNMFDRCTKLKGAISYDSSKIDANYANWTTGYFTEKLLYWAYTTPTLYIFNSALSGTYSGSFDIAEKWTNITGMFRTFSENSTLRKIYVNKNWDVSNCDLTVDVFNNCVNIVGQNGKTYDSEQVKGDMANYTTGYLSILNEIWVKVDGEWKKGKVYTKNNSWKPGLLTMKVSGGWK